MKRNFSSLVWFSVLFLFLLASAGIVSGQATSGSFLGHVMDPQQGAVANAEVKATNEATGVSQSVMTDEDGNYILLNLSPGRYTVSVSKNGFETSTRVNVELFVDQRRRADFSLKLGSVSVVEKVTAQTATLQTESAETGEVIQPRQIEDLPLNGRKFLDLAFLTAGVVHGNGGNTLNMSVNGQREFGNSVLIDGVESTGNRNNDTNLVPSVDSVQEFKVSTSDYSAQFGRASGGVVAIQTKSGTNDLHGSLYEYYRPSATAARADALNNGTSLPSQLQRHNFGGTFGGPIKKEKTFYFVSYEQIKQEDAITYVASVPPLNQLNFLPNGDVDASGLKDPATGNQIPIFDPNVTYQNYGGYAQQFPGNIIPAASVSAAGKATLLNFFPMPNLPGDTNGWYDNFQVNAPNKFGEKNGTARVDHTFSDKDRLSVVYQYSDEYSRQADPFAGAIPVNGGGDADQGDRTDYRQQLLSVTETHLFSPRTLNEFRFGYTRYRLDEYSLLNGTDYSTQFGVGNIAEPGFPATDGYPYIYLGSGYITGGSTFKPLFFLDNNFQFADNLTFTQRGKHEFRTGIDFRRVNAHPSFSLFPTGFQYYTGPYQYAPNGPQTSDPTYTYFYDPNAAFPNGGSDVTDLLLGLPTSTTIGLQLVSPHTQSWELHFYGEDVWKITPRLTLTYGIRYEFANPYTEADNNASNYDPTTDTILIAGRGGNSAALVNARKNNFSPRLGVAYRLSNRTVLRAGYGLFYTPENDARSDLLTQNYPFSVQQIFTNSIYNGAPTYVLDTGQPRTTTVPVSSNVSSIDPSTIANGSSYTTYYIDPNIKTGYAQLFNITVQREITPSLTAEVGYVGSISHDLPYEVGNININGAITSDLGKIQALRSVGWGKYNSLQAKINKQLSHGLQFLAAYTYAHNIDNGPAPFNLGVNHDYPQDANNLIIEKGPADNDLRHNFVLSGLYELPFGKGKPFFSNWGKAGQFLFGGWQLNSILVVHTGLPVNVIANGNNTNFPGLRPNLIADPELSSSDRTTLEYFNTSAFCVPSASNTCPALGPNGIGDAGRNIVRGPGYINGDVSIFKEFPVKESQKVQLRFEFFNLTNTPHFDNPGGDLNSKSTFGKITQAYGERVVQFAFKYVF